MYCALFSPAFAWATTGPPPYFERHLTVRDGLSNNAVIALHQDGLGFLWVGTRDGLNRFDGYQFIPFLNEASGHPCSGTVFSITETSGGQLWAATSAGIAYLLPGTEEFVCHTGTDLGLGSGRNTIFDLTVTTDDRVWAATASGLLSVAHSENAGFDITFHPLPRKTRITRLQPRGDGTLWLGEQHGALYGYDPESSTLEDIDQPDLGSSTTLYALQTSKDGSLWLIGQGLLRRYDTDTATWRAFQFQEETPAPLLMTADFSSEDSPTFYTLSGEAYVIDASGESIAAHPAADLRNSGSIRVVYRTSKEHLWIGSMESGLTQRQINRHRFAMLWEQFSELQDAPLVAGLGTTPDGQVVVGTHHASEIGKSSLYLLNPETNTRTDLGALLPTYGSLGSAILVIEASYQDPNRFFVSTHKHGILDLSVGATPVLSRINLPDSLRRIQAVGHVDAQTLLLGSRTGKLYTYDLVSGVVQDIIPDFPIASRARVVRFHKLRNTWYASFDERLYRYDPESGTAQLTRINKPGAGVGLIYDVQAAPDGQIWIASESGLHRALDEDGITATSLSVEHVTALGSQAIQSIAFDATGGLWLAGGFGVHRFQPGTEAVQTFTEVDGLPTFERSSILKTAATTSSHFFFGTDSHGVIAADMMPPASTETQPVLQITTFTSRGLAPQYFAAQRDTLRFAFRDKAFAFEFALLNYNVERGQRYEYRLAPFEATWQLAETRRYASYTNLPPGHYTLQIRAQDASGMWSTLPLAKTIVITPPWYRTAQAYLAFTLTFIGLGFLIFWSVRQRHKREIALLQREAELVEEKRVHDAVAHQRLQAVDALRRTFLENMSHELRTPLAGIIAAGDILSYEDLGDLDEIVEIIQESGGRLEKTLLSILDFSAIHTLSELVDLETFDLGGVLQQVCLDKAPEAEAKQLDLHLLPPSMPVRLHTSKHYLTEVLNHVIDNAIKFTEEGHVDVAVEHSPDAVSVVIRDTGVGMQEGFEGEAFAPFKQESSGTNRQFEGCGLGLSIAKHALLLMDGDIAIETKKGQGTTVRVTLPLAARQATPEPANDAPVQPLYYSKAS
ncbi:MAG: ATP-binding protein [Bacteroidota bacterium]